MRTATATLTPARALREINSAMTALDQISKLAISQRKSLTLIARGLPGQPVAVVPRATRKKAA